MGYRSVLDYQNIEYAFHTVAVTSIRQKNGEKEATITIHRSDGDLCPVNIFKQIVQQILAYPNATPNSPINLVQTSKGIVQIKSKTILRQIRSTVSQIGKDVLGFAASEIGNHSIRLSFDMFLYVAKVRSDKIMLQGRWRSQAFLTYIRRQVDEFSRKLSEQMLIHSGFYTIPEQPNNIQETNIMLFIPGVPGGYPRVILSQLRHH